MKSHNLILITACLVAAGGISACVPVGDMQQETRSFPLDNVDSASIELDIGAGEVVVQGGTDELFEGLFSFNVEKWKPKLDYEVRGGRATVTVSQETVKGIPVGNSRNRWDISLNETIPLDINVDFGAGEGKLDLKGLIIRSLEINMGVGDLTVDLSGRHEQDFDVVIDGGVGSVKVYIPQDVGVRVSVDKGIGSVNVRGLKKRGDVYTNEAYQASNVTIDIDIDAGVGSIDLHLK
jgi:hypothetical protein